MLKKPFASPVGGTGLGIVLMFLAAGFASHYEPRSPEPPSLSAEGVVAGPLHAPLDLQTFMSPEMHRDTLDLIAQQAMSRWTIIIAMSAVVSMIITALGVWLVARTLKATQDGLAHMRDTLHQTKIATLAAQSTASDTKRIGDEQLRARISIVDARMDVGSVFEAARHVRFDLVAATSGIYPARQIFVSYEIKLINIATSEDTILKSVSNVLFDVAPNTVKTLISDTAALSEAQSRLLKESDDHFIGASGVIIYVAAHLGEKVKRVATHFSYLGEFSTSSNLLNITMIDGENYVE